MGSISGLKSILLLVDLCTCRISGQNQNLKMIYSRRFLVYMSFGLNQHVLWRRCRGLVNNPLTLVLYISTCVLVLSTSFMAPLPGIR